MKQPFIVGDLVTSEYGEFGRDRKIVRRITSITRDDNCGSGWRASASAGDPCPTCKFSPGEPIHGVDCAWFKPIIEEVAI
jgi:hypothetical protein